MAEINFNNIYDKMSGTVKNSYDGAFMGQSFADQYDPTKRVANIDEDTGQPTGTFTDSNPNSLTMKDGYTQMVDAYNQEQQSKTKNSFLSSLANFGSADASEMMPTNGLQTNSMGGITLNPDGSLNYNNTQPQNLGFRSMVDMAADNENFMDQFNNTPRQMSPTGPFNFNNMGQVATNIESAPQPKGMSYEQMLDLGLVGPDQDVGMTAEDLQNKTSFFGNIKNEIGSGITGLRDFLPFGDKSLSGLAVKGIKGLFEKLGNGADYQQYDPNVDYSKFNPNMEINDFYDPRTKTNRFQRATPGSFASFRTGADYFKARREKKEAKLQEKIKQDNIKAAAEAAAARERARAKSITAGYGGGNDNDRPSTGPTSVGAGMGFGGGYASDYGFLKDGGSVGLASMFTRRR